MAEKLARRIWTDGRLDVLKAVADEQVVSRMKDVSNAKKKLENERADIDSQIVEEKAVLAKLVEQIGEAREELEILSSHNPDIR